MTPKNSGRSTGVKLAAIHLVLRGHYVTRRKRVQKQGVLVMGAIAATAAPTSAARVRTKKKTRIKKLKPGGHGGLGCVKCLYGVCGGCGNCAH